MFDSTVLWIGAVFSIPVVLALAFSVWLLRQPEFFSERFRLPLPDRDAQLVKWIREPPCPGRPQTWYLRVGRGTRQRNAATVWEDADGGAAWHTWDRNGVGGENWKEKSLKRAKIEAAAAAIDQGFI